MAGELYISPYPDFNKTISAGRETIRLLTTGEAGNDPRHTVGCIVTTAVGLTSIYPGQPGVSATTLAEAQSQSLDKLCDELYQAASSYRSAPKQPEIMAEHRARQEQDSQRNQEAQQARAEGRTVQRPELPEGFPKAPPYTPEQVKKLQEIGYLQPEAPPASAGVRPSGPQPGSVAGQPAQAQGVTAQAGFDVGQWLPLILQLIDMIRRRRGGQPVTPPTG